MACVSPLRLHVVCFCTLPWVNKSCSLRETHFFRLRKKNVPDDRTKKNNNNNTSLLMQLNHLRERSAKKRGKLPKLNMLTVTSAWVLKENSYYVFIFAFSFIYLFLKEFSLIIVLVNTAKSRVCTQKNNRKVSIYHY